MTLILSGTDGLSDIDGSAATPAIRGTDANTGIFFPAADTVAVATGGTEAMRIDSSGNITVKDKIQFGIDAQTHIQAGGTSDVDLIVAGDTNIRFETATNERMRIDSSGNVGIGTSSPGTRVHASIASATAYTTSSRANVLTVQNTTAGGYAGIEFLSEPSSGNAGIAGINSFAPATGDSVLTFSTRSSSTLAERARIDSSGRLMLGTTTTSISSLDAKYFDGADGQRLFSSRGSTASREHVIFQNPNGTVGTISTSGSATTYATSSDYRLKHDITPMTGALAKVAALKPVTYKWNADNSAGEGFIAHELAEVVPQCVTGEKDAVETYTDEEGNEQTRPKYQGIDTSFLVATLTAAIQEQQALIQSLTARIEALEGK